MQQQVHFCHFSDKGNHGSDGCLGDRPISPWTKKNPFIMVLLGTHIQKYE